MATVGWLLLTASGCGTGRGEAPITDLTGTRAEQIAALEARVDSDRAALAEMVTKPRDIDLEPLHEDERLREIAERLRRDTRALEDLRATSPTDDANGAAGARP